MSAKEGYLTQIELGSNGKLYDGAIPDGILITEPWGTAEEMLLNSAINTNILLDKLITNCCQLPPGMEAEDLTSHDRFQIFVHGRDITYPRLYDYRFKCSECLKKAHVRIPLQSLELRKLGFRPKRDDLTGDPILSENGEPELEACEFDYPIPVDLPCGNRITWTYPTGKMEKQIEKYGKRVLAKNPGLLGDPTYQYRLAVRIMTIDGDEPKFSDILEFVRKKIKGESSLALRDSFDLHAHGIIPRVEPECNHCLYPNGPFNLPFDESFFRPKADGSN